MVSHRAPIGCGGIAVSTGDPVFGDHDGIVIILEQAAREVLLKALDKIESESEMKMALQQGAGIMEAYREYGVL